MEENFINTVIELHQANQWENIINLNKDAKNKIAQKLLWVWPSKENLDFIKCEVVKQGLNGVISLGCGCGLFEWLLQQHSGFEVIGVEINKEWWTSKYSDPLFIPHYYPTFPINKEVLKHNYALLFCYFNDNLAFNEYVNAYKGNLIIIIGPGDGRGTHTEPEPFTPKFDTNDWSLRSFQEIKSTKDYIAVYIRI